MAEGGKVCGHGGWEVSSRSEGLECRGRELRANSQPSEDFHRRRFVDVFYVPCIEPILSKNGKSLG
jgi:hypothetical protein